MKHYLLLIPFLLLCVSCIGQREEIVSGDFTFPGTDLSIVIPKNWLKTSIPGNKYPLLFTEVSYGIKPNIQLEIHSKDVDKNEVLELYLQKKSNIYPDYSLIEESAFLTTGGILEGRKIEATRLNADNTPIIHVNYIFDKDGMVYVLSATCAGPSFEQYETIFQSIMKTVEIKNLSIQ